MKCDRKEPCDNCTAAGRQCEYVKRASKDQKLQHKITELKEAKDALDTALLEAQAEASQSRKRSKARDASTTEDERAGSDGEDYLDLEAYPFAVVGVAYANEYQVGEGDEMDDLGSELAACLSGTK
ncbi:hypothetical protein BDW74DRAFT_178069 [Aspergillus multicolor]|uniref:uncharacterized protein n=1 Tax=Aspergillus multicolor TaxID=41759 RepID=UPI003CCCC170